MRAVLNRFMNTLHCMDACFIADERWEQLAEPSRVAATDLNRTRMRLAVRAVLSLSTSPRGFTAGELGCAVRQIGGPSANEYATRQAAYDIKKLRGKQIVRKPDHSNRYEALPEGLRTLTAVVLIRDKVIRPLMAAQGHLRRGRPPIKQTAIDKHYQALQGQMRALCTELGIAA